MKQRNFIGRLVGRKRNQLGWTQDFFADRLQLAGWHNATRNTVSKIEDCSLGIDLIQVYYIATALNLDPGNFLAGIDWREQIEKIICSMKPPQPAEAYGSHRKNESPPTTQSTERLAYSIQDRYPNESKNIKPQKVEILLR